ncbi:hypothetical protein GCM10009839_68510 [Catenulispora yoronensis]|uniref:Pimeloyl-ACP methyl ester carboxylesterase n=2 Tax=Catenulispora yoronensis TaxID=450799 RepID=A0ABN2V5K1_9ACTN
MVRANGVDLCVEQFGDPAHPTILLVHGASASMLWWPRELCERLAAGRRHVIRFDNRDTGRSTTFPVGRPGYSLADLADDAIGILDALGVERAHLIGRSMAGGIVTLAALLHPDRVDSLTLVSTTTGGAGLPGMAREFIEYTSTRRPNPSDPADVVDFIIGLMRVYAGESPYFDEAAEAAVRAIAEQDLTRTADIAACLTNHFAIDLSVPDRAAGRTVDVPVLILHGDLDPVFPPAHALATQQHYPGSQLVILPRTGHDLPPQTWDVAVPAILNHTSGGWEAEAERIFTAASAAGDSAGWFETLYNAGAEGSVELPWSRREAHALLVQWATQNNVSGAGRTALVVGCGLGADAEFVAELGFDTTAFDASATAVRIAEQRFPGTKVHYQHADLFEPPADWSQSFDLVVEIFTVQALPRSLRDRAISAISDFVAPDGTLFVVYAIEDNDDSDSDTDTPTTDTPPWPLTRAEVESFADGDLTLVTLEKAEFPGRPGEHRWRGEFRRLPADLPL